MGGVYLDGCGLHWAAEELHMKRITENGAYGDVWLATGWHAGCYGTSGGVHLAACGLHLAAQGLHMQHMAVYAAYGCWLAGWPQGHKELRGHAPEVVKWGFGGVAESSLQFDLRQKAIQQPACCKLHSHRGCNATNLPELQILPYCK